MGGFADNIKKWFGKDKESVEDAKGVTTQQQSSSDKTVLGTGMIMGPDGQYHEATDAAIETRNLLKRYSDYEMMDDYPELSASLDIYADDSTIPDTMHKRTIWATSEDALVREIIDDLFHRRLRVEDSIWGNSRTTCKYGNNFAEIIVGDKGVVGLRHLPVPTMRRIEDEHGKLIGFVQDPSGRFNTTLKELGEIIKKKPKKPVDGFIFFEPWEIAHWRLMSKDIRGRYGHGVLEGARYIWPRLRSMEDMAVTYKLTRSPARFAYYIDTGELPPKEAMSLVERVRRRFQKTRQVNQQSEQEFKYNVSNPQEDLWVPTRNGREGTRIDMLSGPDHQGMEDVEYFRNKMLSTVKVPRRFLGLDDDSAHATLSQQDVRFGRSCMRVQRELRNGYGHVVRVHLAALGIDPDTVKWQLHMTVPSTVFELGQIELRSAQAELAGALEAWMPRQAILQNVLGMSQDDAAFMDKAKIADQAKRTKLDAAVQAEIMKKYPELAGMMPAMMGAEQEGSPPGGAPAQESVQESNSEELRSMERSIGRDLKQVKAMLKVVSSSGSK